MNRLRLYLKSNRDLRRIIRNLSAELSEYQYLLLEAERRVNKLDADLVDARFDTLKPGLRRETPFGANRDADCYRCADEQDKADGGHRTSSGMYVCESCGNKRCPHGTDHRLDCTGSNEPGQEGSRYGNPR